MQARTLLSLSILAAAALMQGAGAASPRSFELLKTAMALAPDTDRGKILYIKHCTGCHGPRAKGSGPREVPALAGQREYYLIEQLVFFSALDRNAPVMHEVVKRPELDSAQALRDLAAYLSHVTDGTPADHGDGRNLAAGERVYAQQCSLCHGKNGEGSNDEPIPAIGGQHYNYILGQLESFAGSHRGNVEPPALDFAAGLSPDERKGVADYISRLTALRSR